ncbi:MAG: hypothetical protein IJO53_08550 [Clostridia bacterium]|nr:hypothetical protein [Clostridia bacterium]
MQMAFDFLKVYGLLLSLALAVVLLTAIIVGCILRLKQLEKRVSDMEAALTDRMDKAFENALSDQKKQRRLLSESMANLSESMTRAILTMNKRDAEKNS